MNSQDKKETFLKLKQSFNLEEKPIDFTEGLKMIKEEKLGKTIEEVKKIEISMTNNFKKYSYMMQTNKLVAPTFDLMRVRRGHCRLCRFDCAG